MRGLKSGESRWEGNLGSSEILLPAEGVVSKDCLEV
jgi:hypothetical protein